MEQQEITYASIIPLIGGMILGAKEATGKDPEYIVSYDAFAANDAHARKNFNVPFGLIQEDGGVQWDRPSELKKVDFVVSLCPCAGLSALNSSNKEGSERKRGSDAIQNEWMYKSSRFVLENIKPKVLWGENAPALYTKMGDGVVKKLREIAKEYGYSFTLIKTSTFLHGIPQKRDRSFYFFWDSSTAPVMEYYTRKVTPMGEYLSAIPEWATYQDIYNLETDIKQDPLYKWLTEVEKKKTADVADEGIKTILIYLWRTNRFPEAIEYLSQFDDKVSKNYIKLLERAQVKNVWDSSPHLIGNKEPTMAIVGRLFQLAVHPSGERWLNLREHMHLMGIPHDYQLANKAYSAVTQNVPVNTARDWTYQVMEYIKGALPLSNSAFLKQNNYKKEIEYEEKKTSLLF